MLEKLFEEFLEEVKDESPLMPLGKQVEIARDRLIDKIIPDIYAIADRRYWQFVNNVNKAFYG
jgi:hypothetical protein